MQDSPMYSEREQTPAQRQALITMGRAWSTAQCGAPGPVAEAIYARYVAGEITLQGVTDELVSYYQQRAGKPAATAPQPTPTRPQYEMQPASLELA